MAISRVRPAEMGDADRLAALLRRYLEERFPGHLGTSAERLRLDVLGDATGQRVLVAEREGELTGFVAWDRVYDLHWGLRGVQIADLYVVPECRGYGLALTLLVAMCAEARAGGATFLRGASYDRSSATGRFYERLAIGADSAECTCSGRAFRHLAELHGKSPRAMLSSLPRREWNFEA